MNAMTAGIELPGQFVEQAAVRLGPESEALFQALREPAHIGLRVNTLKLDPDAFLRMAPFEMEPLPWGQASFRVRSGPRPGTHPFHAAGLYYLQEPAAQAVAEILAPEPGERVLDLAAAPGGKATHLAAKMNNQGLLVANDPHTKRVWDLMKNLERWGARNTVVLNETPERLAEHFGAYFDRVLVDAPCSGEGMFRKGPEALREWSPELVTGCSLRQRGILKSAARLVRPGGWLAYATCTFNPEENEASIARFLDDHPEFSLSDPVPRSTHFSPGRPDWLGAGADVHKLTRATRLWPHRSPGEGHFIALMRRDGGEAGRPEQWRPSRGLGQLLPFWQDFAADTLEVNIAPDELRLVKSYLYRVPADLPDLGRLKVIRPGWWLGSFKKNRFEPAHALAMGLKADEANRSHDTDVESVQPYLRRETLSAEGGSGWLLVTLAGHPIGWGKRVGTMIKNHYPKGLRQN
jgi:NOL1/NOP2/sun family putative RNA methylase